MKNSLSKITTKTKPKKHCSGEQSQKRKQKGLRGERRQKPKESIKKD